MTFRAAVVGCGRIGSTTDDEHQNKPQFRYPWAHAPAYIEAKGVDVGGLRSQARTTGRF